MQRYIYYNKTQIFQVWYDEGFLLKKPIFFVHFLRYQKIQSKQLRMVYVRKKCVEIQSNPRPRPPPNPPRPPIPPLIPPRSMPPPGTALPRPRAACALKIADLPLLAPAVPVAAPRPAKRIKHLFSVNFQKKFNCLFDTELRARQKT